MGLYFVAASRRDNGFVRTEKGGGLSNKFGAEAYRTHRPGGIVAVPLPRAGGQAGRARPMFSIIVCVASRLPKEGTHESAISIRGKGAYRVLMRPTQGSYSKGTKSGHQLAKAAPDRDPVRPHDLTATVFHLLGIDPRAEIHDRLGRPYLIGGVGCVRSELLA